MKEVCLWFHVGYVCYVFFSMSVSENTDHIFS